MKGESAYGPAPGQGVGFRIAEFIESRPHGLDTTV